MRKHNFDTSITAPPLAAAKKTLRKFKKGGKWHRRAATQQLHTSHKPQKSRLKTSNVEHALPSQPRTAAAAKANVPVRLRRPNWGRGHPRVAQSDATFGESPKRCDGIQTDFYRCGKLWKQDSPRSSTHRFKKKKKNRGRVSERFHFSRTAD